MKNKITEFIIISFGTLLVAVGVYFFKFPNHFSTGGVSGLSIIFGSIYNFITPGTFVIYINFLFLILGFIFLNKEFGIRTVYCSILMSLIIRLFEIFIPLENPITNQRFLELIYSVIFPAIGSAIIFNYDASTGGTDIAAMILKKYTTIDIGTALLISDFLIACSSIFLFGIETGLFSIFGLGLKAIVVDSVIENINIKKEFTIITKYPHEICNYINNTLKRGATILEAHGAFTDEEKWVVITALNRNQANNLKKYIKKIDKSAFILITNTMSVIGKGFREV